ncbi:MAG: FtsX-like permease family protein [Acidobacteriota bacterium]
MKRASLIGRSLMYYWRSHLAVVLGVATAVSVLAGALVVGDSVRASLKELFLKRLGQTDDAVLSKGFFGEDLAQDLGLHPLFEAHFESAAPLVMLEGVVSAQASGRRASQVQVYGVDERFWEFHGREIRALSENQALVNSTLARELGSQAGDTILVSVENPSLIPLESLHGRRQEIGQTMRCVIDEVLPAMGLDEFTIRPQQSTLPVVFVALSRLQQDLEVQNRANALLLSRRRPVTTASSGEEEALRRVLAESVDLEDLGVLLRRPKQCACVSVESNSTLINQSLGRAAVAAADGLGLASLPMFTYLANVIRSSSASIPYSLVSAVDLSSTRTEADAGLPPIWLNDWAAGRLAAAEGEEIELEYYLWAETGELMTESAQFRLAGTLPTATADPSFTPQYPGISDAEDFSSWDPPFPIDLSLISEEDEEYWDRHRTTPKAFIPLNTGRELWGSRFGDLTSIRVFQQNGAAGASDGEAYERELKGALDPFQMGFSVVPARAAGMEASQGATDFGEFFLYFSFFLMVSALLLAALFFRLGVEQRLREIGLLRAVGFPPSRLRFHFLAEGAALALAGSALGIAGAWVYGSLIILGLETWWIDAVNTTELSLHLTPGSLILGAAAGVGMALLSVAWSLRRLMGAPPRRLLSGSGPAAGADLRTSVRRSSWLALLFTLSGLILLLTALLGGISEAAGFFGAGILILAGLLALQSGWLRGRKRAVFGHGWPAVFRLGMRNASHRPGRSILCIAFIASASFIIVAVEAFRHEGSSDPLERQSGTGGFSLLATSVLPLPYHPNSSQGREDLNLIDSELRDTAIYPLRLRPGEDVSCINLYRPQNPKVLGVPQELMRGGRFRFQDSLAETSEEQADPWLLLERVPDDGTVPVIADATSMRYVLHQGLGEEIVMQLPEGKPLRLRLVAALADSIFQGELLMSEENFIRYFPQHEGYRFFLMETAPANIESVAETLEDRLSDFGFDVVSTAERLAAFHRVENTYLSTFQLLGALGLILGTAGLATVLLRNVLERRRELALLRAIGYRQSHFSILVLAENAFLLASGLLTGLVSALLAIVPALIARGEYFPGLPLRLLVAVVVAGALASILAAFTAFRTPLLSALKEEA